MRITQTILIIFLLAGSVVEGAFLDIGEGARPQGMGKAYVGVADDANALFYNTAGMTQIKKITTTTTYTKLYVGIPGLNDGSIGLVIPSEQTGISGPLGISGTHLNLSGDGTVGYSETTLGVSYAYMLNDIGFMNNILGESILSTGIKIKGYNVKYGDNEWTGVNPAFGTNSGNTSKWGIGSDLSFLYQSNKGIFRAGMSLENILQPDMGLEKENRVPYLLRLGASYKLMGNLLTCLEMDYRGMDFKKIGGLGRMKMNIGGEYWIFDDLGVRSGFGFGLSTGNYSNISVGFSYKTGVEFIGIDLGVDYAFVWPFSFIEGLSGTHKISLNIMEFEAKKIRKRNKK